MDLFPVDVRPLAENEVEILENKLPRYTSETHRDRFEEQSSGATSYLVAWLGRLPAGYARVKWRNSFMLGLALRDTPTIGDVTVRPDLRSHGIGGQIMEAAEELVRSKGHPRLALGVATNNARAIEFYHRRGYFDAGIPPERSGRYLLAEGEWWQEGDECLCLVKELTPGASVFALARAKINLHHRVGPQGRGGFHTVKTVMQSISLADEIVLGPRSGVSIGWAAGLEGDLPGYPDTVGKTIRLAARRSRAAKGTGAKVIKRIPIGAGLAGGSADAAAALKALAAVDRDVLDEPTVARYARRLGTDVAFCLKGGLALGSGRGDRLTPLKTSTRLWWVVAVPDFGLSTKEIYGRFDELADRAGPRPGGRARLEDAGADSGPKSSRSGKDSLAALTRALEAGDLPHVARHLFNDLEAAAFDLRPPLRAMKQTLLDAGALGSVMTGSGSAIIGLCESEAEAVTVAQKVRETFARTEVAVGTQAGAELVAGDFQPES